MARFIKYILLISIAFIVMANLISLGSLYALKSSSFYKPSFLVNSVDEKNFDYIILGSSVGLTTLDTKQIDAINNSKGINLSMDDTGMSSQYLMLHHFLAEGKHAKYCVLAPGIAALENKSTTFGDNDYRFLMYVDRDYIYEYYKNADTYAANVSYLTRWFPFIGISYYNTELFYPSLQSIVKPKSRHRFDDKGNYTYPNTMKSFKREDMETQKVSLEHPYLSKIKTLCDENNIELIYYFAPMRGKTIQFDNAKTKVINHSRVLKEDTYFYDDIHVNYLGRTIVSEMFAKEVLKELGINTK